ncbi:MAG TPA: CopG family transcriptional regulator [Candidatus Hydrogenedentes bacterium]|nr:CopG family transcriptional regulator [Candidatus Hydrogenedentota bacterium]
MKTVTLKLDEGLDKKLSATARKQGTTKSDLLRKALLLYMSSEIAVQPGSCLDLADDLIGCVEGPADLSTNKEYIKGFGT